MVVDDDPDVLNLIANVLAAAGHTVEPVGSAMEALTLLRSAAPPDLMIVDVIMPGMDGGEVAARLRKDPLLRNTPVIFLTGIVSIEETGGHELVRGGETFLAKPVDTEALIECIEKTLSWKLPPRPHALSFSC